MSAECHICGKDLPYDLNCEWCELRTERSDLEWALGIAMRALRWYANEKNWQEDDWNVKAVVQPPDYGKPGGKAQRALERIEGGS